MRPIVTHVWCSVVHLSVCWAGTRVSCTKWINRSNCRFAGRTRARSTHWRRPASTTKRSVRAGDADLHRILTTCSCWYCPHGTPGRIYETVERPSVCLVDRQQQRRPASLLLSTVRSWGAGAHQRRARSTASSSKCGQCHVDRWGMKLNRQIFILVLLNIGQ